MQQSAYLIIVPASALPVSPEGFRDYVEEYFAPKEILGQACFQAFLTESLKQLDNNRQVKGVAPYGRAALARYTTGLDGRHLSDWIDQAAREGVVSIVGANWDDGRLNFGE